MGALKITGQSAEPTVTSSDAGTVYYDTDTNKLRFYNGSAWADVYPNQTGDVVSVADGGTTIQTDAVDIAMLSASGTASGDTFLRGDNAWATPASGSVLQVSSEFFGKSFTQDIDGATPEVINDGTDDWEVSITPSAASAGVTTSFFCIISIGRLGPHNSGGGHGLALTLNRTTASVSTDIGISTDTSNVPKCTWAAPTTTANVYTSRMFHGSFMDSVAVPSTPVAIVYRVKLVAHSGGTFTALLNRGTIVTTTETSDGYQAVTGSSFTVMEIAG